jgi:hypothetical protein
MRSQVCRVVSSVRKGYCWLTRQCRVTPTTAEGAKQVPVQLQEEGKHTQEVHFQPHTPEQQRRSHKHIQPKPQIDQRRRHTTAEHKHFNKCKKRAQQRWCRWLTATKSRIGGTNGLREALGPHWQDFVDHANRHYKPDFVTHFSTTMRCCGDIDGNHCPHAYTVDPWMPSDLKKLAGLHLDHSFELSDICDAWKNAIQDRDLKSWDEGVDGELVCHLLFGVNDHPNLTQTGDHKWRAQVHFRCGESKQHKKGNFCHDTRFKHQNYQITANNLKPRQSQA